MIFELIPQSVLDRAIATVEVPTGSFVLNPTTGVREMQTVDKTLNLYFKESGKYVKVYVTSTLLTTVEMQSLVGEPFQYEFVGLSGVKDRGWVVLDKVINQPSPISIKLLGYCFLGRKANGRDELRMGR